jgi:GntR family transcriptional regulator, arabinose operon transcriptional repressor
MLKLDLNGQRKAQPKYQRLKEHLIGEMLSGRLKPGQALPSEQALGEKLGIATMTVRQAMTALQNDGLVRRVPRQGTFVDDNARRRLKPGLDIFALVVPETREAFYPSLLHGFETAAAEIQHQAIVCSTNDDVGRQADILIQLIDKKVGGVALNPTSPVPTPAHQVRLLHEHGIPVVFCHRRVEGVAAPLLSLPYYEIGRLAGNAFVEHGHRSVAFITSPSPSQIIYEDGLNDALRASGVDPAEIVFIVERTIQIREESCFTELQKLFARPDPPTAIFTSFDSIAELIYMLLLRLGLRVPEDVSLVGVGGSWREGAITRMLTSVVVDEIATGRKAVELLDEMRCGARPIDDNTEMGMEISLSDGKTLGIAKKHENNRASSITL